MLLSILRRLSSVLFCLLFVSSVQAGVLDLRLKVDQISNFLNSGTNDSAVEELRAVRDIVEQASAEVRRSIASLQETPQPPISLQTLLTEHRK